MNVYKSNLKQALEIFAWADVDVDTYTETIQGIEYTVLDTYVGRTFFTKEGHIVCFIDHKE
jgi:hypothetical protein